MRFIQLGGCRALSTVGGGEPIAPAVPVVAQKSPYEQKVEVGKKYFWCSCGLSKKQPWCGPSSLP